MPLHHWKLSSTALRYYHQLELLQWLAPERIRELQEARLKALVKHAYRHVSYYRERLDRLGIQPDEIQRIEDLQRLPVLRKDDIRKNLHFDLLSDSHDKLSMLPVTTSGSNGQPLTLYTDRMQLEMRWATTLRCQEWTGYRFGDRQVRLWGSARARTRLQALRAWLDALSSRRTNLAGVEIGKEQVSRALRILRDRKPVVLEANAEVLPLVASAAREVPNPEALSRAVLAAECTLSAGERREVEEALRTELFAQYRSPELSVVAQECEQHQGYHVNAESYIVEIVAEGRPAEPGEAGDVLITDLTNLSVPLIRYAIGDRAVAAAAPCPCGRGLPLLAAVQTRPPALVSGANQCWVPGEFFADALKDYGHVVRRFQVVQERSGAITFRIVKGPRFSESSLRPVLDLLRRHLGTGMEIDVQLVDHIEPDAPHTISGRPGGT
jgi:phenylacetate-CoA ligase